MNPIQHFIKATVWVLLRLIYRVRVRHSDRIPRTGAAVLTPNHVTFLDALLIAAHTNRPIRYAMHWKIYKRLKWVVGPMGAFPIASKEENPVAYERAFTIIADTLDSGGLLCIFPEGKLTRDGAIGDFRNGILKILERNPVPVIPVALTGLWGSYFSKKKPGMLKLPGHFMAKIQMTVGEPLPSTTGTVDLRTAVLTLVETIEPKELS
jgi:1-acyl-sn-glycerol-3-phosphate acyltransferase